MDDAQGMVRAVVTTLQGGVGTAWTGNTLLVTDGADFPRDGGQFIIDDNSAVVYTFTSVVDGETEDDPDIITTVEPAPAGLPKDDEFRLTLWPTAVTSVAEVALPESVDDTVPAIIPHALKPFLVDGIRDPEAQESVTIAQRDMAWVVVDILDQPEVRTVELIQSVEDAKTEALAAHQLAGDATVAAQDAHNAAVAAAETATAATVTADSAAQAAAAAAAIADGKADVFIQSSAPGAEFQTTSTLWIDITEGANTPKRWDGSNWVAITDKAAVDAANAAAVAKIAADNAKTIANNAKTAADNAQNTASNAQDMATSALTSANGRNSRMTSTSAPGGGTTNPTTGLPWVKGDTWWRWDSTTARNVIGTWTWDGGAWQPEKLADQVLTSLDVNKLTVSGSTRMAQAVVDKIIGDAAFFKVITADRIQLQSSAGVYYDPQFADAELSKRRAANTGWAYDTATRTLSGNSSFWLTYNAQDEGLTMPLIVGQRYFVRVVGTGFTDGNYTFAVRDVNGYTIRQTTYTQTGMEFTFVPAAAQTRVNAYSLSPAEGTLERVEFMAMVGNTIIEPGAITTDKLNATAIDGMTITGAKIRTASSGARVELDSGGLKAYNSSGVLTASIYGAGGSFNGASLTGGTITGATIKTAASGQRVELAGNQVYFVDQDGTPAWMRPSGGAFIEIGPYVAMGLAGTGKSSLIVGPSELSFSAQKYTFSQSPPESQWQAAKPLFLDANGIVYSWANAPQRPVSNTASFASGTSWNSGAYRDIVVPFGMTVNQQPKIVVADLSNFPGGSAYLVPRVVSWTTSQVTVRVTNTGASSTSISGELTVRIAAIV